ncbi:hypothetical protein D9M68_952990 [compost metagenome]
MVFGHLERALDAGAAELHFVAVATLLVGAAHVELGFGLLGPFPGHFSRAGEAQLVFALDLNVGHGLS